MSRNAAQPAQAEFDTKVADAMERLSPAERQVARFFVDRKQAVLLNSAAQIAEMAGSSDATVVRTVRSLGFGGLSELREVLLTELTGTTPGSRLAHTLEEAGGDAGSALHHVIGIHHDVLDLLKTPAMGQSLSRAVDILAKANRRHVFGIGPSGAMANYATLQFNRIGLPTSALSSSGIALADGLLDLRPGDAVLILAYAPLYREAAVTLDEAQRQGAPVVLISDDLAPLVRGQIVEVLPVPRGKADHLAMHGGTMVLLDAMIISLAARASEAAIDSLDRLSALRGAIDKSWIKRGTRKK
ncbi:MAG: MurR/RpiR family transcriptional regulator [Alphaproteobacteria bacterium]|nr:MurR/RpiR family transcriptional regulator [Alphaproteobacteria bacterium]